MNCTEWTNQAVILMMSVKMRAVDFLPTTTPLDIPGSNGEKTQEASDSGMLMARARRQAKMVF